MKYNNETKVTIQYPIFGILGLIFITLKLTGHIAWSWWWVLSPFWLPFALVIAVFAIIGLGWVANEILKKQRYK